MTSTDTTISSGDAATERYREAERILRNHYGLEPTEHFVDTSSPAAKLRVVEVGSGSPLLFVPGSAGTGPYWGGLVRELEGFRCLLLDRPGWGLSTPLDYSSVDYRTAVSDLMRRVLVGLEIERADVIGASIGDVGPCSSRPDTPRASAGSSCSAGDRSWPRAAYQPSSG